VSKIGSVSKRIKINGLSLASVGGATESINVGFVSVEPQQQYNGNLVLSKEEVKRLGLSPGDSATVTITLE
jgi:hypothetical protein